MNQLAWCEVSFQQKYSLAELLQNKSWSKMAAEIELLKCCYIIHYFLKSTLDPEHKSLKVTQVFERNILQAINVGQKMTTWFLKWH